MVKAENKKVKTNPTIEESMEVEDHRQDRISLLPDCLIIVILSLLGSTIEAIRTSTLSRRWQHLWTYVPNLIFSDSHHDDNHLISDFYSFVDKTLIQCRLSNLNVFRIQTRYDQPRFESQVHSWIRFAVNCKVQEFRLALWNIVHTMEIEFELPSDIFFTNSCFTNLSLTGCLFNPTGVISWNNLTSFFLSGVDDLNDDLIQNIVSGSPLLEKLTLHRCFGFRRINITSKSVKKFILVDYVTPSLDEDLTEFSDIVEINAPYIESLTIKGDLLLRNILLQNVSSLVKTKLDYMTGEGEYDDDKLCDKAEEVFFKGLILGLRHVKEVKVGTICLKVFSCLEAQGFIFPSNLKVIDPTPRSYSFIINRGEYDSDSNESDDSEEQLFADGSQSEGDEAY